MEQKLCCIAIGNKIKEMRSMSLENINVREILNKE
jgi:hypothetical protein